MIGLPGSLGVRREDALESAGEESVKSEAEKRPVPLKTMMGMTSPFMPGPPQPLSAAKRESVEPVRLSSPDLSPARASEVPAAAVRRSEASPKSTMLGVAPPPGVAQAIREANAKAASESAASAATQPKRTMMGVSAPSVGAAAEAESTARSSAAPASASTSPTTAESALGAPAAPSSPARKVSPKSDRTMIGIASQTPSLPAEVQLGGPNQRGLSFTEPDDEAEAAPGVAGGGALRRVLAMLAGALAVVIAFAAVWFATREPDIRLRVTQGEEGEQLEIEVPSAEPGAKVRFLGAEQELVGGVARFPLAADSLALGENELTIGVVRGGAVKSETVHLNVAYRARVDLAGLSREPPTLDVVLEALPGSKVTVDGEPLALDARGHGVKSYPIAPQTGSKLAFTARYRVEPKEGGASEGALALSLPVTSLQIDRPGPNVTTDQSSVEVAGAVEAGAEVLVDGKAVRVTEGRFLHRVQLGKPGEYTIKVLARGQGKAPRAVELKATRVADLALAAASFKPDPALTYARIAQNPVIYRGQNVAFDGRVYNVEVKGGGSHLQMLVRDCPGTQRCPLWVDMPQDTDVTVDTWVRVLGTVAGEQQFRSERGQVHTVPSVRAQYVLKLAR